MSGIRLYGDTVHLFIDRKKYNGIFMPGYEAWKSDYQPLPPDYYMWIIVSEMLAGTR